MAEAAELDLVEVAPRQRPPVARILDYSKFIYEQQKKNRDARNRQRANKIEIKTIKLKLATADYHRDIQVNKRARKWLTQNKKVKVEIRFRGREITYPELGRKIMDEVAEELQDVAIIESRARMEGRTMIMMLTRNPAYKPPADEVISDDDDDDDDDLDDEDDIEEEDVETSAEDAGDGDDSDDEAETDSDDEGEVAVSATESSVDSDEQPAAEVEEPKADSEKAGKKPAAKSKKKASEPAEKKSSDKE